MNSPSPPDDLPAQLVELEQKLMFQQRAFDDLNSVVLGQRSELENLRREVMTLRQLIERILDRGDGEDLPHEKPPHY